VDVTTGRMTASRKEGVTEAVSVDVREVRVG
jgi:hypothetical protein